MLKKIINKAKNSKKQLLKYANYLSDFASNYIKNSISDGYIIGLSGGIDSAVVLALLANNKSQKLMGVFIDIDSSDLDRQCAKQMKEKFNFIYQYVDLTSQYKQLVKALNLTSSLASNNLKSRMRMITLYALAQENNLLVAGTSNADELLVGYYTKFGDSCSDVSFLCRLTKSQINYLAKQLEIPEIIINRVPSASLYEGQTDEKEIGIDYATLDRYLAYGSTGEQVKYQIKMKYQRSLHKIKGPKKPKKLFCLKTLKY